MAEPYDIARLAYRLAPRSDAGLDRAFYQLVGRQPNPHRAADMHCMRAARNILFLWHWGES